MELSFNEGKFVSLEGELNYKEVLSDFPTANIIRILTYNISKNQRQDMLLDSLRNTNADVQIITNVPSRMEQYRRDKAGQTIRSTARRNIHIYISKLNPESFSDKFSVFFNTHNHAKIIGTENIVYIGSANFSNESANNIETGVIIKDKDFIQNLYIEFFDNVKANSLSYFDDSFSAFYLFVISLRSKFAFLHRKFLTDLYTDYERTKQVVADSIFLDLSDLSDFYNTLDELNSVCGAADDTYDEENEIYNAELEQLKSRFDSLCIDWLKDIITEDGTLYRLIAFNIGTKAEELLQSKYAFEAYDENLGKYMDDVMNDASEIYASLHASFEEEADEFLKEIERILSALDAAISFAEKWKASKINPEIDNT